MQLTKFIHKTLNTTEGAVRLIAIPTLSIARDRPGWAICIPESGPGCSCASSAPHKMETGLRAYSRWSRAQLSPVVQAICIERVCQYSF